MYRAFLEFDGVIDNVQDLNKKIEETTDIPEFFNEETDGWMAWVEYKDGKTFVLEETAD